MGRFATRILLIGGALALTACVTPAQRGSTQAGPAPVEVRAAADCGQMIRIGATTTAGGIAEQDAWIAARYPGATKVRQAPATCGVTPVERITFNHNGTQRTVVFDVSSFFGKVGTDDLDDLLDG